MTLSGYIFIPFYVVKRSWTHRSQQTPYFVRGLFL